MLQYSLGVKEVHVHFVMRRAAKLKQITKAKKKDREDSPLTIASPNDIDVPSEQKLHEQEQTVEIQKIKLEASHRESELLGLS